MSLWLAGIGVSRGIVIGRVYRMVGIDLDIPEYEIPPDEVDAEAQRFEQALVQARRQLQDVRDRIPATTPADIAAFIDTHLLMLEDKAIADAVVNLIRERHCNAEWALKLQRDSLAAVFDQMDDAYLKTRRDDVDHVVTRVLRVLLQHDRPLAPRGTGGDGEDSRMVLVAEDITPADIILLHQQGLAAFVTEYGGPLSHTAILARSLGIPAIVGLHHARRLLEDGETIIIDGLAGHALAAPDTAALDFYRRRQRRDNRYRRMLGKLKGQPALSLDHRHIGLLANIDLPEDTREADAVGAEGVGLYRTEFLYMNRDNMPDEEEQYEAYARVVAAVNGPITIRTLDLGADKRAGPAERGPVPGINNPALGLRAIRLCLRDQDAFRVQLRALLRASTRGEMRIMLPMISTVQELRQTRHIVEEIKAELRRQKLAFNPNVPVGAMIEVPAAALAAPLLARYCDFFSIGTNDLIQYTLAIDRGDDQVNYLYDPLHPAVLRLIQYAIESGAQAGIPVAMCGEMAGDTRYTRLLLGLGLTEFSMHPANVLEVKRIITQSDISRLRGAARRLLEATDGDAMQNLLQRINEGGG